MKKQRRNIPGYCPKDEGACLCGSGLAFAACCADRLPGFEPNERVNQAWAKGDRDGALLASRAELCQYAIWHKSHTAPFMAAGDERVEKLLKIDIEALSDYVGNLVSLLFRLGQQRDLPVVLERIRCLIGDPRWQRRVTYHQALVLDACDDHAGARAEFLKLGPIDPDSESDIEILQAYLDLFGSDLSFAQKLAVCDRILRLTRSIGNIIQYRGVKAMCYAGVGDVDQGKKELAYAIAHAHMRAKEKELGARARLLLASGLSFLALFSREERRFVEAEAIFRALLADQDHWSDIGRARLWDHLGECYRYWGKFAEADQAYRESIVLAPSGIRSVFLAECQLRLGHKEAAIVLLDRVDFDGLSDAEQLDYVYTAAEIAVESLDRTRLKAARDLLQAARSREPYFERRRLEFIIVVQEALAQGPGVVMWQALKDLLAQPLRRLNRYIMLQPNVAGIGINLNAMIEDSLGPKDKDTD